MIQAAIDEDQIGPNISSDAQNFFQSDRDLEIEQNRQRKKAESAAKDAPGKPITLSSKVLSVSLSNDRKTAYTAESGHVARKVDLATGRVITTFKGHAGPVTSVAIGFTTTGDEYIITSSWDKTARRWNATGEPEMTYNGHADFVKKVVIFGKSVFTASSDGTVRQWDALTGECLRVFKDHTRAVEDIVLTEDGSVMYSASSDTTIKKWDTSTGQVLSTLRGHLTSVYALLLDDGSLWSASADKTAKRWDLETETPDVTLEHPDFVKSLCLLPGAAYLVTGCRDENVRIWDVASEKCIKTLTGHYGEVSGLACLGSKLYSASLDGTIRTWLITDLKTPGQSTLDTPKKEPAVIRKTKKDVTLTEEEERELAELMGSDDDL
ncbi:hypothetical protein HDU85_000529 [Gaertneriomyces sp. JEL0708]|nr:hypothetical protein HDU85_000529 [Gaertneriomyces sp. JEL0708]